MNKTITKENQSIFEEIKQIDAEGNEYWLGRELMKVLGYDKWSNFNKIIVKAKESLSRNYPHIDDHFAEVGKKIKIGSGSSKEAFKKIKDYKLSRRACYIFKIYILSVLRIYQITP